MSDKLPPPEIDDSGFFGHPKGLRVLFFAEMWERFSFYGMRALLVLYMVTDDRFRVVAENATGLSYTYSSSHAYAIYGAYGALVYAFPVLGGWIANRWIGYRNSILLGGSLMALGHFAMAFQPTYMFFLAMSLLCVGNGFFKPNISSTVGRLYRPNDSRRDRGFTIFYMGINMGAMLAPLVCGFLGEDVGWHYGFATAGVGMVFGLIWFVRGQRHIGKHGDPPDPDKMRRPLFLGLNTLHLVWLGALVFVPAVAFALYEPTIADWTIYIVSALVVLALVVFALTQDRVGMMRLFALMILMVFQMLFFAGFEQAGSSFNVLTNDYVNRSLFGWDIPASVFQMVNPFFILAIAPMLNVVWRRLDEKQRNPSIPIKFALGLGLLGAGFYVLTFGINGASVNSVGSLKVALGWMLLCYFLHTVGELCLSPIGLSAVTKLAPEKWVGFCMGAWFLTIANAHLLAAAIAKLTTGGGDWCVGADPATAAAAVEKCPPATGTEALAQYSSVFKDVALVLVVGALIIAALSPWVKKLMKGVN